jgi:ClpP class serine protease
MADDDLTEPADASRDAEQAPAVDADTASSAGEQAKVYDLSSFGGSVAMLRDKLSTLEVGEQVARHVDAVAKRHKVASYSILYLYDEHRSISAYHSNQLYQAVSGTRGASDVLLIINSGGGRVEPAYLISKAIKRMVKAKFVVAVPRRAKSAATLLAFGADEIHMGLMSELGPIDPQIGGYPALALSNSLEVLGRIVCEQPGSSDMLAAYLGAKMDLQDLGFFKRVTESAEQYAERLLQNKKLPDGQSAKSVAHHFVNYYKDHGFVIDTEEAKTLLGDTFIREDTAEYTFADEIYALFSWLDILFGAFRRQHLSCIGALPGGLSATDIED